MAGEASVQRPMLYKVVCCLPSWPLWRPSEYRPVSQERLGWAWDSPAAVLSLPTGVLEQLRSMVEDSEDAAPGLQPV